MRTYSDLTPNEQRIARGQIMWNLMRDAVYCEMRDEELLKRRLQYHIDKSDEDGTPWLVWSRIMDDHYCRDWFTLKGKFLAKDAFYPEDEKEVVYLPRDEDKAEEVPEPVVCGARLEF